METSVKCLIIRFLKMVSATIIVAGIILISCIYSIEAAASGSCGNNASWELSEGLLTISGNGDMTDFSEQEMAPWYSNRNEIQSIYIEDGITSIGSLAFYHCENLERIQLPNSIERINELSLTGCKKITTIYLSDKVKIIGDYAFEGCESLKFINLPVGLSSIGYHAFYLCDSLTNINIPFTVNEMGDGIFSYCDNLVQVNIDGSIDTIPAWTFYGCTSLVSVSLSPTISNIGYYSFKGCDALKNVFHEGLQDERDSLTHLIKRDVPTFSGVRQSGTENIVNSDWQGTTTNPDGSVTETDKEVIDTDNSTIQTEIQVNKPVSDSGSKNDYEITVDATVKGEKGWEEVTDKIDAVIKYPDIYEDDNTTVGTVQVNVQVKDNVVIKSDVLSKWAGESVQININTAEGTSWSIRGEDLEAEALSGNYELSFTVTKNEEPTKAQKKVIGDSVSYLLEFEDELPFKVTVNVPLPIEHARDYATLYQKPLFKGWEEVQTVVVDDAGKACFNLQGVDGKTKYLIGINVPGAGKGGAIIPESLYDDYGGLTDSNGVHYEITGTRSSIGISFTQLTLILVGIVVVSAVIVGIVVKIFAKAKYRDGIDVKRKGKDAGKKNK